MHEIVSIVVAPWSAGCTPIHFVEVAPASIAYILTAVMYSVQLVSAGTSLVSHTLIIAVSQTSQVDIIFL